MSYLKKIEYEIILKDSLKVIRNCPKCGRKTYYINTKKFRINANGNKLDVWLIYQCAEYKHTLNITIYERKKASSISKEEYQCLLDNNEQHAEMYGKNKEARNHRKQQFWRSDRNHHKEPISTEHPLGKTDCHGVRIISKSG